MPAYSYRCKTCGAAYETHEPADRLSTCANDGCDGPVVRVWGGQWLRSSCRAVSQ